MKSYSVETEMDPLPLTTPAAWIVICVMRLSQPKILWEDTELVCIQDVHAVDVIIQNLYYRFKTQGLQLIFKCLIQKWLHGMVTHRPIWPVGFSWKDHNQIFINCSLVSP